MLKYLLITTTISMLSLAAPTRAGESPTPAYPEIQQGRNLGDCVNKLHAQDGGWCEIRVDDNHPSISSVWPKPLDRKTRMFTGPTSILIAWNSAAFDEKRGLMYFMGGGHGDYGGNEVYEFDLNTGRWTRLTEPSPLENLFVAIDYGSRPDSPWRRLCWMPHTPTVPASAHTYDGLQYSTKTDTFFNHVRKAADGACFEDEEDRYKNHSAVLGDNVENAVGWYEFNPSRTDQRNGLQPLTWRKVLGFSDLEPYGLHRGFPVSAELPGGDIVLGSNFLSVVIDPKNPKPGTFKPFAKMADWGDATQIYDAQRDLVWSIHGRVLLAFAAKSGKLVRTIKTKVDHGKSLAFDKTGKLVFWNGASSIYTVDPDERDPRWQLFDWQGYGPGSSSGQGRVYGKWVYLKEHDLFAGISDHSTGVWIYKQPKKLRPTVLSTINAQQMIYEAKANSTVTIPPGTYGGGLHINKSLTVKLAGVNLRGIAKQKGIINVECNRCQVLLEDFHANGPAAGCVVGDCAGIKAEGVNFDLTVKRAHIDKTVLGILTDNRGGAVTLEDSLIENTGLNDRSGNLGHGFYAGDIDSVVIRDSTVRRSFGDGHLFKSRAPQNSIEHSVIAGMDGRHSRTIDLPCSGTLLVRNSTLQHGANADNADIISVGTEPGPCQNRIHPADISILHSWIIIDRDESPDERAKDYGYNRLFNWQAPNVTVKVANNRIVESTGRFKFDGEGKLPDMSKENQLFDSRAKAGLGPEEIPPAPAW